MADTSNTTGAGALAAPQLPVIELHGQRVITLATMDKVHGRPEGTARKRFNDHKAKMVEGEDFFVRNSDEARAMGVTAPNGLILLTESGYLLLVKSFTDDLAWRVQRQLVNGYFRAVGRGQVETPATDTLIPSEQHTLGDIVHRRAAAAGPALQAQALAEIWSRLHDRFRVTRHSQLPRHQLTDAIVFVSGLALRCAPPPPPAPAPALLSRNDMANLTRMIHLITNWFGRGSETVWRQAIWAALRRVTGNPAPYPFRVDHLPLIVQELKRCLALSVGLRDALRDTERDLLRHVVRQGQEAGPILLGLDQSLTARALAFEQDIEAVAHRWGAAQVFKELVQRLPCPVDPGHYTHCKEGGAP